MATEREQRRLVHLTAQLRVNDDWCAAIICNVSSRGLMAKCANPPAKGATVEVRHHGMVILGEVIWSLGERFGLRSPTQIDLVALQEAGRDQFVGRRSLPRSEVHLAGEFVMRDDAYTVLLVDISQSGARVHMPIPPRAGISGALAWAAEERDCTVLWSKGSTFGVAFHELLPDHVVVSARIEGQKRITSELGAPVWADPRIPEQMPQRVPAERRRSHRTALQLDCEIRQGESPWLTASLENVSRDGFSLAWFAGCQVAQPLDLRLPDGTILDASIERFDDQMIACSFLADMDQTVLERVGIPSAN